MAPPVAGAFRLILLPCRVPILVVVFILASHRFPSPRCSMASILLVQDEQSDPKWS